MGAKTGIVGILIILAGAFPLLNAIGPIKETLAPYAFLSYVQGGQPLYQIIIILLGVLLIWNPKPKAYPREGRR